MTTPPPPAEPVYADRTYRSPAALVAGVLLLGLLGWLCGDAIVRGTGRAPWFAGASLLLGVPLIVAFTLRPVVFANDDRLRVRNPFRLIVAPWGAVDALRAAYSAELLAGGRKYQLWSVPVSLRQRKRANRTFSRRDAITGTSAGSAAAPREDRRATADRTIAELNELHERNAGRPTAQGEITVRWAYEILVPLAAGVVMFVVLLATG
ncbi:PH domain-containing protein [Streptomyces sp. NPDC101118]|uniref:PH domain-containing protein n=1 Tax=Streptomyces sp. NPDC101118 TaxID=3366109 RepID=UPI0037F87CD2